MGHLRGAALGSRTINFVVSAVVIHHLVKAYMRPIYTSKGYGLLIFMSNNYLQFFRQLRRPKERRGHWAYRHFDQNRGVHSQGVFQS
ncbi:MAG: hypothetical protein CM1200mP27_09020 [Chloroflexota bacterium]|nr:MAG: hypothetical protein CM1200mP27_09020 [Chloroflexota bacterium]